MMSGCASSSATRSVEPQVVPVVASAKPQTPVQKAPATSRSYESTSHVDLYKVGGDDWTPTWNPEIPPPASFELGNAGSATTAAKNTSTVTDTATGEVVTYHQQQGYRVQLANVMSEEQAKAIKARASALFANIYIIFRSPNYKVRAGDFTKRSDADRAVGEAKQMGFRGAWVVPDRVNVRD